MSFGDLGVGSGGSGGRGGSGVSSFNTRTGAVVLLQADVTGVLNIQRNVQSGTTYTIATTDFGGIVALTNAAARTITLPLANTIVSNGLVCMIKDESGTSSTAAISITLSGGDTLEGSSGTFTFINRNYSAVGIYSDGVSKYFAI